VCVCGACLSVRFHVRAGLSDDIVQIPNDGQILFASLFTNNVRL